MTNLTLVGGTDTDQNPPDPEKYDPMEYITETLQKALADSGMELQDAILIAKIGKKGSPSMSALVTRMNTLEVNLLLDTTKAGLIDVARGARL